MRPSAMGRRACRSPASRTGFAGTAERTGRAPRPKTKPESSGEQENLDGKPIHKRTALLNRSFDGVAEMITGQSRGHGLFGRAPVTTAQTLK